VKWLLKKDRVSLAKLKVITLVGLASLGVIFLNPHGLEGVLQPLQINQNYGYRVLENQNLFFIERVTQNPVIIYFKIAFGALVLSWLWWVIKFVREKRSVRDENVVSRVIFSLVLSFLGWSMLRNLTFSALFLLPLIASNIGTLNLFKIRSTQQQYWLIPVVVTLGIFLLVASPNYWEYRQSGIGLRQGVESAGSFFKQNGLSGPIFNNYDIGGYLIYELYPKEKVFVDNRPETYPVEFFQKVYIPSQEEESKWKELDAQYKFNAIIFYRHDLTPWAQKFLISRVQDNNWAPVFVDDYNIIFVKRNEQNLEIIKRSALPEEMFKVSNN
jgi:hypothetical protein